MTFEDYLGSLLSPNEHGTRVVSVQVQVWQGCATHLQFPDATEFVVQGNTIYNPKDADKE